MKISDINCFFFVKGTHACKVKNNFTISSRAVELSLKCVKVIKQPLQFEITNFIKRPLISIKSSKTKISL